MCGITGAVWTDPRLADCADVLARMTDVLCASRSGWRRILHRANCGLGAASDLPGVALGHRRLAIIDLAAGHQPHGQRGRQRPDRLQRRDLQLPRAAASARGERPPLPQPRATPRRSCISTRTKGSDFVRHLIGMFALAIWDARRRRVWCWPAIGWARSRSSIDTNRAG